MKLYLGIVVSVLLCCALSIMNYFRLTSNTIFQYAMSPYIPAALMGVYRIVTHACDDCELDLFDDQISQ